MLSGLLLTLNILVWLGLIGVVLLQRSEGGALGGGGGPTGLVTTRGAGDLLTRTTWVLFSMFLGLSLALTLIGGHDRSSKAILDRLKLQSVNPASLVAHTKAPASAPGQSVPPVQAAGGGFSAPKPSVRLPGTPSEPLTPPAPGAFTAPAPTLSLPPIQPTPAATAKPTKP